MRGDLYEHVGLGQVEAGVGDLAHEDRVDLGVELEVLQDLDALVLRRGPVDVGLVHLDGVVAQREHVVREHDGLVAAPLVVAHEELARAELRRVHHV